MTVASTDSRKTYAGNGATTSFATSPVVFFDSADLTVYVTTDATGTAVTLAESTDYSVTGGSGSAGTVDLTGGSAPYGAPATGTTLVIVREVAATQESDLINNDPSDAEVIETAFDRLTMITQQLITLVGRAFRVADSDVSGSTFTLPAATTRANSLLGFDALGRLTVLAVQAGTSLVSLAASAGAALVGFLQSGTGATARTAQDKMREFISVKDYGAVGDGVTDDTAALNVAFAMTGRRVLLPKGNYKVTSNLTEPVCAGIIGEGEASSFITAATGVTRVLSLGSECTTLRGFCITGNATTAAIGIIFGDAQSGAYLAEDVLVTGFTGTSAVGVKIQRALKSRLTKLTVQSCTQNILLSNAGDGLPTTITFDSLVCGNATGVGCKILFGESIVFNESVFESNGAEGLLVQPTGTNYATHIVLNEPYMEANNSASNYQALIDASGTSSNVTVRIKGGVWSQSGSTKAIKLMGTNLIEFVLDGVFVNTAAGIRIQDSARGKILNWSPDLVYATIVSDAARTATAPNLGAESEAAPWISWTPTFSSNIGDASATFNGAVTVGTAKFRLIGQAMHVQVYWTATLKAVTPAYIDIDLPSSLATLNGDMYVPGSTKDNGLYEVGFLRGGNTALRQYRAQFGNYTSGGNAGGAFNGVVELA